jgi:Tfp pilus assembly protein PilZ
MERREEKRFPRRIEVTFSRPGDDKVHRGFTGNVSRSGLFIHTHMVVKPGTRIQVELRYEGKTFAAEAMVVRAGRFAPELQRIKASGIGVRFLELSEVFPRLIPGEGAAAAAAPPQRTVATAEPPPPSPPPAPPPPLPRAPTPRPKKRRQHPAEAAIERFTQEVLGRSRGKAAQEKRKHLEWWRSDLGEVALDEMDADRIEEARARLKAGSIYTRKRSQSTVDAYLATLSELLDVASREWGWLERSPLEGRFPESATRGEIPREPGAPVSLRERAGWGDDGVFRMRFSDSEELRQVFERDIRTGGLFLPTGSPASLHAEVQLEVLVGTDQAAPRVRLAASVVQRLEPGDVGRAAAGMGVQFKDYGRAVRELGRLAGLP